MNNNVNYNKIHPINKKNISLHMLCEAASSQIAQISSDISKEQNLNMENKTLAINNSVLLEPVIYQLIPCQDSVTSFIMDSTAKSSNNKTVKTNTENNKPKISNYSINSNQNTCQYCYRVCTKPSVLEKHLRTHTNERPYPCTQCNQSFKTLSNLHKHHKTLSHINTQNKSNDIKKTTDLITSKDPNNKSYTSKLIDEQNDKFNTETKNNISCNEKNVKYKLRNDILRKSSLNILDNSLINLKTLSNEASVSKQTHPIQSNFTAQPLSILPKQSDKSMSRLNTKTATTEMICEHINELISKNEEVVESNLNLAPPTRTKSIRWDCSRGNLHKKIAPKFVRDENIFLKQNQCSVININYGQLDFSGAEISSCLERQLSLPINETKNRSIYSKITKSNTISDPTYIDSCPNMYTKRKIFANTAHFNLSNDELHSSISINSNENVVSNKVIEIKNSALNLGTSNNSNLSIPSINYTKTKKRGRPKGSKSKKRSYVKLFSTPYIQNRFSRDSNREIYCKNILKEHILMKRSYSIENSVTNENLDLKPNDSINLFRLKSCDSSMPFKKRLIIKDTDFNDNLVSSGIVNAPLKIPISKSLDLMTDDVANDFHPIEHVQVTNKILVTNSDFNSNDSNEIEGTYSKYVQYLKQCTSKVCGGSQNKLINQVARAISNKYKRIKTQSNCKDERFSNNVLLKKSLFDKRPESYSGLVPNDRVKFFLKENLTCNICNKICASAQSLSMHWNVHFLDKQYKCQLGCPMSFEMHSSLLRHQLHFCRFRHHYYNINNYKNLLECEADTNKEPRPFKCNDCSKGFRNLGHLNKHLGSKFHAKCVSNKFVVCDDEAQLSIKKNDNVGDNLSKDLIGKESCFQNCEFPNTEINAKDYHTNAGTIKSNQRSLRRSFKVEIDDDEVNNNVLSDDEKNNNLEKYVINKNDYISIAGLETIEKNNIFPNSLILCNGFNNDSSQNNCSLDNGSQKNCPQMNGFSNDLQENSFSVKNIHKNSLNSVNGSCAANTTFSNNGGSLYDGSQDDSSLDDCSQQNGSQLNSIGQDLSEKDNKHSPNLTGDIQSLNKCAVCGFSSDELPSLLKHLYTHIPSFKCDICDAAFLKNSSFVSHTLLHKISDKNQKEIENVEEN